MRDIVKYEQDYLLNAPFEKEQIRMRKRKILEFLHKYQPKSILEIGCGIDPIFFNYSEYDKYFVVEPSYRFCEIVKGSEYNNKRVIILNSFFEHSIDDLKNLHFDFIIFSCLLHEVESPELFVSGIHEISAKNTIIHVNVPNAKSFHRLLGKKLDLLKSEYDFSETNIKFQQSRIYDKAMLHEEFTRGGFEIVESGSYFIKPFTHQQMENLLLANILPENILDGLFEMSEFIPEYGSELFINCRKKSD